VAQLRVHDVDPARAEALVAMLRQQFGDARVHYCADPATVLAAADGLVNCTPVGMAKLTGTPIAPALLHRGIWVAEIIYFPLQTALRRDARALGCRTLDGSFMAVFQAVGAFRLFTGQEPDAAHMQACFAEMTCC